MHRFGTRASRTAAAAYAAAVPLLMGAWAITSPPDGSQLLTTSAVSALGSGTQGQPFILQVRIAGSGIVMNQTNSTVILSGNWGATVPVPSGGWQPVSAEVVLWAGEQEEDSIDIDFVEPE